MEKSKNMLCKLHKSHTCDLHKALADKGLSPDAKAKARVARGNVRYHYDSHKNAKHHKGLMATSYDPGHKPHAGKPGHKVAGHVPGESGSYLHSYSDYEAGTSKEGAKEAHAIAMKGIRATKFGKSEEEAPKDIVQDTVTEDKCPYCEPIESTETDDCPMCQELDAVENADGTAGMHDDCPMCKEMDAEQGDDCPMCQEMDSTAPAVEGQDGSHPDDCPECQELYSQAPENQPAQTGQEDPNLQGHETAKEVLAQLDQEPGGQAAEAAKQIDNTEMPQGDQMKDNTSVTDNFGQAQKNDIPDSDAAMEQSGQESGQSVQIDEPDMTQVLQGGLDDHANEQKKQQVLDMVGQTLQGFKANKASLEATKEQNQPLYNSCIQMLKSMIELCKLLGLEPQMAAPPEAAPSQPAAPAPNAAPSEGAAQDPKLQAG